MKKLFSLLLTILLLPMCVFAMDNSSVFDIGDSVTVSFDGGKNKIGFHVIKNSAAGESTVTLLYDGAIATYDGNGNIKEGQVVYQLPSQTGDASIFEGSYAQQVLKEAVNQAGWIIYGSPRLLEANDFANFGINKDNDGTYTILTSYDFLKPHDFVSAPSLTTTDYWTQISDGTNKVYVVTKDGASSSAGISAKVKSYSVDPVTSSVNYSLRPVVVLSKEYVLCNNTKPATNVNTGVADYAVLMCGVLAVSYLAYINLKKKNMFKEI